MSEMESIIYTSIPRFIHQTSAFPRAKIILPIPYKGRRSTITQAFASSSSESDQSDAFLRERRLNPTNQMPSSVNVGESTQYTCGLANSILWKTEAFAGNRPIRGDSPPDID